MWQIENTQMQATTQHGYRLQNWIEPEFMSFQVDVMNVWAYTNDASPVKGSLILQGFVPPRPFPQQTAQNFPALPPMNPFLEHSQQPIPGQSRVLEDVTRFRSASNISPISSIQSTQLSQGSMIPPPMLGSVQYFQEQVRQQESGGSEPSRQTSVGLGSAEVLHSGSGRASLTVPTPSSDLNLSRRDSTTQTQSQTGSQLPDLTSSQPPVTSDSDSGLAALLQQFPQLAISAWDMPQSEPPPSS